MRKVNKIMSAIAIVVVAMILCVPAIFMTGLQDFIGRCCLCAAEGFIILLFSKELWGD